MSKNTGFWVPAKQGWALKLVHQATQGTAAQTCLQSSRRVRCAGASGIIFLCDRVHVIAEHLRHALLPVL